ncbi:PmoA family protein [Propioniciclava soli]|uniref:PmoA family protein n=1 Tax=Propioniciclava soli TaxID=2775081 RepID=A0ABZ3C635_9ACTN
MSPLPLAQVGVRGFGRIHLERIARLEEQGRVELVATADPGGPLVGSDLPWYASLTDLLAEHSPAIASLATPIGTHAPLATEAMRAGAHVMLEKPPVASLTEFWQLLRACKENQRVVQIGFQSLGSAGIARMQDLLAGDTLGEVTAIAVRGAWVRDRAYYARSPWAGKRTVDGRRIADGVVTNPLAHSIATALKIADATRLDDIVAITTEMYHAHAIDADDTSFVRLDLADAPPICAALTLCATEQVPPTVTLVGTRGEARYSYTTDELWLTVDGEETHETFERTDLLENLVDHLTADADLLVPLADTVGFMCVLEATQDRPAPVQIAEEHLTWVGDGAEGHPVISDIERWLDAALAAGVGFAEAGAPWGDPAAVARWQHRTPLAELRLGDAAVAEYADGSDIMDLSSPRPYLHPIRTLGGVIVSDTHPVDHDWHCGLSLTMQDVNGVNFWGGRTYVRGRGYTWLGDQGRIEHRAWLERTPGRLREELAWVGPILEPLEDAIDPVEVRETRELTWTQADDRTWLLDADLALDAVTPDRITLGGPGTNGRTDAGYGGWQLRLRRSDDVRITSPLGEGAEAVYGQAAAWVAWRSTFIGRPVTLAMAHLDADAAASDRWFVRHGEFDGIGTALAWSDELTLPVRRRYRLVVADGHLTEDALAAWLPRSLG